MSTNELIGLVIRMFDYGEYKAHIFDAKNSPLRGGLSLKAMERERERDGTVVLN